MKVLDFGLAKLTEKAEPEQPPPRRCNEPPRP